MQRLLNHLANVTIRNGLDIATGSGEFISLLTAIFPNIHFTGIDPNEEAIAAAQKKFSSVGFTFLQMKADQLLFTNHSFDLCTVSNALHHIESPPVAISEMRRVTKPEGWIIISELQSDGLNPAQENHKLFHHHRSAVDRIKGVYHRETYTHQEIVNLFKAEGMEPDFQFEYLREPIADRSPEHIARFVQMMKDNLNRLEIKQQRDELKAQIALFEQRAKADGLQAPPNLVLGFKMN